MVWNFEQCKFDMQSQSCVLLFNVESHTNITEVGPARPISGCLYETSYTKQQHPTADMHV